MRMDMLIRPAFQPLDESRRRGDGTPGRRRLAVSPVCRASARLNIQYVIDGIGSAIASELQCGHAVVQRVLRT
jgi:hypothetical protein